MENIVVTRFTKIFLVTIIIFLGIGIWKWYLLPPQLPLFYSLPRSNDQLGSPLLLLSLPLFAIIFFVGNFTAAIFLRKTESLAAELLVIIGSIAAIIFLIAFIKIILLIT